jgi:5,10-methylenetetrahydromethanopterin reductase
MKQTVDRKYVMVRLVDGRQATQDASGTGARVPVLSCALAPARDSHEHARIAEELGYARAYFYDSPAVYSDVWMALARAAAVTTRISLGPAVLVPSNRHPMANAAAIATLVDLTGEGRVVAAIGSGFSGRIALGQRPLRWAAVAEYIRAVRGLLRGETVTWEGAAIRMLHSTRSAPPRPIDVPFLIAAGGTKGYAVAQEFGDGVLSSVKPIRGFAWSAVLIWGTVVRGSEPAGAARVLDAAGHGLAAGLHSAFEYGELDALLGADAAGDYRRAYDDVPDLERHLEMYAGHCESVPERDAPFITAERLTAAGIVRSASDWSEKIERLTAGGATEIVYQPAGNDIAGELETFATSARQPAV